MANKNTNKKTNINRRQFIIRSAVGVCGLGAAYGTYEFGLSSQRSYAQTLQGITNSKIVAPPYNQSALFFNQHQYAMVAIIAGLIIPADDEPGANEANVVDYIDKITAGQEKKEQLYSKGLDWLDKFCLAEYGEGFLDLSEKKQLEVMNYAFDDLPVASLFQRVHRKINHIWAGITGTQFNKHFFWAMHDDIIDGFYSNPISWQYIGYFGPPNPVGYPDFSEQPSPAQYLDTVRQVDNASCITCHEIGEHPRGGLIDHSCTTCHRPHQPWPYDDSAFYLENYFGVIFSSPDRKNGEF